MKPVLKVLNNSELLIDSPIIIDFDRLFFYVGMS